LALVITAPAVELSDEITEWVTPSLSLEQAFDTLVADEDAGARDTLLTRAQVGLAARATPGNGRVEASYRLGADLLDRALMDSSRPEAAMGWRHQAAALLRYGPTERTDLSLSGQYLDSPDPIDAGGVLAFHSGRIRTIHGEVSPQATHRLAPHMTARASYRFLWDDLAGFHLAGHRAEVGLSDRIDPRNTVDGALRYDVFAFDGAAVQHSVVALASWRFRVTPAIDLDVSVGPRLTATDAAWAIRPPDLRGAVGGSFAGWRGSISFARGAVALPGVAGLHDVNQGVVGVGYTSTDGPRFGLEGSYIGVESPEAHAVSATAGAGWRFTAWLVVYAAYRFGYQTFVIREADLSSADTHRHIASIGVAFGSEAIP
jgi:hypothetical protein